jgi:hypothetical protein
MGTNVKNFTEVANKTVNEELRFGPWQVCNEYRYVENGEAVYAEADLSRLAHETYDDYVKHYEPLRMTGLFLELAGLGGQTEITREDWRDWNVRNGLLGGEAEGALDAGWGFCGGPKETFSRFCEEARSAYEALRLYETTGALDDAGLLKLGLLVQKKLSRYCRPQVYRAGSGWVLTWEFKNLLGAMWLQMAWLMTAPEEDVRRCEWCNGVMDFQPPEELPNEYLERIGSGGRKPHKPHSHRKYHEGCRQKAYYHRKKARQQG